MGECSEVALHTDRSSYPLAKSTLLDSASNVDIFNDRARFTRLRNGPPGGFIWAGDSKVRVAGIGQVTLQLYRGENPGRKLAIVEPYYCPTFLCNVWNLRKRAYS